MRILFIGTVPTTGTGVGPDTMEAHVCAGLGSLGASVTYFPFLTWGFGSRVNRLLERARTDRSWLRSTPRDRALLRTAQDVRPDLVLMLLGNYVAPQTIAMLREVSDAPIVCWCQDHMGSMGRQYIIGARFDFVFAKDARLVDLLRRFTSTKKAHYLAEACNPAIHRTPTATEHERERFGCEIATAATLYYFRAEILSVLADRDLKIWGTLPAYYAGPLRAKHGGRAVFMRDKALCFAEAKIVINSLYPLEIGGINARAFEVAGCGGFQLITHSDAVAVHFEPGAEIETFADLAELRDKVDYYLGHDAERKAIAHAGQRRAHAEHTYVHRLTEMLGIVFPGWQPPEISEGKAHG